MKLLLLEQGEMLIYTILMENLKLNGSGIKNISSVSYIKKIDINLPPIELQNKFAERVEKIEKLSFRYFEVVA